MNNFVHSYTPDLDKLWVIAVVSNPARFKSRYSLFEAFRQHVERRGVNLMVVEVAFGDRPFEVTHAGNPNHVQLRTNDEIWHKENMINIGISRLPQDWKYVAWIDADVEFVRTDWPDEIVHQLQHHPIVQVFQTAIDLGPSGEAFQTANGFAWCHATGQPKQYANAGVKGQVKYGYPYWHAGYGWAARRETIEALGGLFDVGILGAGDHHMAWAFIGGALENSLPNEASDSYKKHVREWQDRALKCVRGDIGYVPGTILHHWHGKKADRKYVQRWDVVLKHNFDPDVDICRDWQGLYRLTAAGERMRLDLRRYFFQRNEDSIDL